MYKVEFELEGVGVAANMLEVSLGSGELLLVVIRMECSFKHFFPMHG